MKLVIKLPDTPALTALSELPVNYRGPVLKGANITHFSNGVIDVLDQTIHYGDFAIRLFSGQYLKKFEIMNWFSNAGLYGSFMLKNGLRKKIDQIGKVHVRKDHHIAAFINESGYQGVMDHSNGFQILDIFYSPALLEQLVPFFPDLKNILAAEKNTLMGNRVFWTPLHIREIYSQLLESEYDAATQQLYFDLKVREILFHLLQNSLSLSDSERQFTPYEVARIHDARSILENSIGQKPPTIRELSRMVALNEFKLKQGFRKYFNTGIFGWITAQKMHRAKELLEQTNKPIKEIAALSGYPRTTNFITAFRKHFGITPGAIRRS